MNYDPEMHMFITLQKLQHMKRLVWYTYEHDIWGSPLHIPSMLTGVVPFWGVIPLFHRILRQLLQAAWQHEAAVAPSQQTN